MIPSFALPGLSPTLAPATAPTSDALAPSFVALIDALPTAPAVTVTPATADTAMPTTPQPAYTPQSLIALLDRASVTLTPVEKPTPIVTNAPALPIVGKPTAPALPLPTAGDPVAQDPAPVPALATAKPTPQPDEPLPLPATSAKLPTPAPPTKRATTPQPDSDSDATPSQESNAPAATLVTITRDPAPVIAPPVPITPPPVTTAANTTPLTTPAAPRTIALRAPLISTTMPGTDRPETTEASANPATQTGTPFKAVESLIAQPAPENAVQTTGNDTPITTARPDLAVDRHLDLARGNRWLDTLVSDIVSLADNDGRLRFALSPPTLGRLEVDVRQGAAGMSIHMTATTDTARDTISSAQPRIIDDIRAQGVRIVSAEVASGSTGFDSQHADKHAAQRPPSARIEVAQPTIAADVPKTPVRAASARYA